MANFENIKARFERGFIRPDQLKRFLELGVITKKQYTEITKGTAE